MNSKKATTWYVVADVAHNTFHSNVKYVGMCDKHQDAEELAKMPLSLERSKRAQDIYREFRQKFSQQYDDIKDEVRIEASSYDARRGVETR
jgi:hypothetical protein